MTTPAIIDAVVVILLVIATALGARRGLLKTLAGLVILVVALIGAGMIATSFSPYVAKVVTPLMEDYVSRRVEEAVAEQASAPGWEQVEAYEADPEAVQIHDLLERLGIEAETWDAVTEQIRNGIADTGTEIAGAVADTVAESLVQSVVYGVLYILAFLLLALLLHILLGAMGLVMKLPGLHFLNAVGGGLLGFVQGALLLFLLVWVARQMGVSFETEPFLQTNILRIFTTNTPLSVLVFLTR